jgi:hypothetical protein
MKTVLQIIVILYFGDALIDSKHPSIVAFFYDTTYEGFAPKIEPSILFNVRIEAQYHE